MLTAANLVFSYRPRRPPVVLDDVSLDVGRGRIVGLLGPNGSGKTTLLRLLAGMLHCQSGTVSLNGRPVSAMGRRELAREIAVVPQETQSAFDFSVLDMVLMGRSPHLGPFQLEGENDVRIAEEALAATGTAALRDRVFSTLSGGERQRVVIASALAQQTGIILLDEPTASLDLRYQLEIAALLQGLNEARQTTLVISTHDLHLAAGLCHELVLLKGGRVIAQGAPASTLTPPVLRDLYGVDTTVTYHAGAGQLTVTPIGPRGARQRSESPREPR